MSNKTSMIKPTHPGDVLREDYLKPLDMTPNALAIAIRVAASRIGEIVNGKRGITARFWLQAYYDLAVAEDKKAALIEREVQPREMVTA